MYVFAPCGALRPAGIFALTRLSTVQLFGADEVEIATKVAEVFEEGDVYRFPVVVVAPAEVQFEDFEGATVIAFEDESIFHVSVVPDVPVNFESFGIETVILPGELEP